jgi:hypothetical protein
VDFVFSLLLACNGRLVVRWLLWLAALYGDFIPCVCLLFSSSSSLLVLMEALINFADSKKKHDKKTN